jgi:lipoprotein-releasing system permease protein
MLSFFIARSYFAQALKTKSMATPLWLSIIVLFAASFALTLAISITQAFQEKVFAKFQETNADAIIYSYGEKLDNNAMSRKIARHLGTEIKGVTSQNINTLIITHDDKQALVTVRSIECSTEKKVLNLGKKITSYPRKLSDLLIKNNIIIGSTLAENLKLRVNTETNCFIPQTQIKSKRIALTEKEIIISGIFKIGLDEFDANTIFCSTETFNAFFKNTEGSDTLLISFNTPHPKTFFGQIMNELSNLNPFKEPHEDLIIKKLRKLFPDSSVSSWKDLYPAIISAMKLEKLGIICILLLLILVSLFSVISSLVTLIYNKKRDIALFQILGMPRRTVRAIFLWVGMIIVIASSFTGSFFSFITSFLLEHYKLIVLPDIYYVSYLPASQNLFIFISIPCAIVIISLFILLAGIWQTQKINSLETLRHTT